MKIVIVGAGAAGIFAAIAAAEASPSAEVVVLEKTSQLLSKVKISGGGRCNVTHHCFEPQQLVKNYPRGYRELLGPFNRFQPRDTIEWFAARDVELKTESDGRMFPTTDNSQTIIDCLLDACNAANVQIKTQLALISVEKLNTTSPEEPKFRLLLNDNSTLDCHKLLLASGGNASSKSFTAAAHLGHTVEPIIPSLFTFNCDDPRIKDLPGIAVKQTIVTVPALKLESTGPTLITHWGFSGPAILRLSAWGARLLHSVDHQFDLEINWLANHTLAQLQDDIVQLRSKFGARTIINSNPFDELSKRLWESLVLNTPGITATTRWSDLSKSAENALLKNLHACEFSIKGKSTNKDEFVSCGGIKLSEVNFKTMESKICPGLFFAGEILDIDGITGGFNFQAAWTTGYIAGQSMAQDS